MIKRLKLTNIFNNIILKINKEILKAPIKILFKLIEYIYNNIYINNYQRYKIEEEKRNFFLYLYKKKCFSISNGLKSFK